MNVMFKVTWKPGIWSPVGAERKVTMTWAYEREWVIMVMGSLYCDVPAYVASHWALKTGA